MTSSFLALWIAAHEIPAAFADALISFTGFGLMTSSSSRKLFASSTTLGFEGRGGLKSSAAVNVDIPTQSM